MSQARWYPGVTTLNVATQQWTTVDGRPPDERFVLA